MERELVYRFTPVNAARTSEKVVEQFVELIRAQNLKPGDRLPSEQALAQALGVSRATVREALSGLKALGLVVSRSGKGNFVAEDDSIVRDWDRLVAELRNRSVFLDALEARKALESEICFLAAQRATEAQLKAIQEALELGREANSTTSFGQADYQFHHALALASGNRLFIRFMEECFHSLSSHYWDILRRADSAEGGVFATFYREHRGIYHAIAEHNPVAAREKVAAHIETVRANFLKALRPKSAGGGGGTASTS